MERKSLILELKDILNSRENSEKTAINIVSVILKNNAEEDSFFEEIFDFATELELPDGIGKYSANNPEIRENDWKKLREIVNGL